ncbi:MAG: CopG family transcriptional regulator [Clostridium sp.]|mgnify:CR=1 FL=1|nr:CopG family transcriptional regulator [Clostridium sp.]
MSDFIPKSYKKEQTTIRIDAEKMKKIDELANSFNLSRSEFINQCIDFALEHMAPEPKQKD